MSFTPFISEISLIKTSLVGWMWLSKGITTDVFVHLFKILVKCLYEITSIYKFVFGLSVNVFVLLCLIIIVICWIQTNAGAQLQSLSSQ